MTESLDIDDRTLARRAEGGDVEAFRQLVRRYHRQLHGWALALAGDPDDADDVVQAALIRMHRGLQGYKGDGSFASWLYSIARSAAADLYRSRKRRKSIAERIGLYAEPTASQADAGTSLDRSRLNELVISCYRTLPGRQREIFTLAHLQGYSTEEIAQMIGIEAVTVRTHLLRARRTIRTELLRTDPELVKDYGNDM